MVNRLNKFMKCILGYNDYMVVIINLELFILNMLMKRDIISKINEDSERGIAPDIINAMTYFFINLLMIK